jgi:hypothetical protein
MGTVNISYANPMADKSLMKYDIPFQTFHSVVQQIQSTSFTAAWSLPSGCFVNGVILAYTAINPYSAGANTTMPARTGLAVPPVLTCG